MSKRFFLIYLLFLVLLLLISGCGKKECEKKLDCGMKACFDASCVDGSCVFTPQQNCCGNKVCEDGENECSCKLDCGVCGAKKNASSLKYLSYGCGPQNDVCALDLTDNKVPQTLTFSESAFGKIEVDGKLTFDQPFDMKTSDFNVEVQMTDMHQDVSNVKITKIQIMGSSGIAFSGNDYLLAEKELDRPLWEVGSKINEQLIAQYEFPQEENNVKIEIKVFYEYDKSGFGGMSTDRDSISEKFSTSYVFVVPTREYDCDSVDCDDANPGTKDVCIPGTKLCTHEPISKRCGNYICESGENKCSCPEDCGPCEGQISTSLENMCYQNQCVSKLIGQSPNTLSADLTFSQFKLTMEADYNEPFEVDKDTFDLTLQLTSANDALESNVVITKIELVEGELQLGKLDLYSDNSLETIRAQRTFSVPVNFPIEEDSEESKRVKVKVHTQFQYTKYGGVLETVFDETKEHQFKSEVTFADADV